VRLSRRGLLALGGSAAVAGGLVAHRAAALPAGSDEPVAVEVRAAPIANFSLAEKDRRRFGALTFRSGVELQARAEGFGGFSGLWRSPDGQNLVAITDNAQWFTARVATQEGRLAGLADAVLAPLLGQDGKPLRRTRAYDSEGLAIVGGTAYVSFERVHEVRRFDWGRDGVKARGAPLAVPPEAKRLPSNKSLEAIGVAPARHLLAGAVIAIAERARGEDDPTQGFILTGPRRGSFDVARSDGFDVTDLVFLPSGEMLILERRFSVLRGVACRLRRVAPEALRPGALVDGPVIFAADGTCQIDNMEGVSLHTGPQGEIVLTLISDDNFSALQRTLLLEFTLEE
jgi:hypothetical protein